MKNKEIVSLSRCNKYSYQDIKESMSEVLKPWGSLASFFKPGASILIKPNLLAAVSPEEAVTTHPLVLQVLAELAKEAGAEVYIGDSPAISSTRKAAAAAGMLEAAQESGARLIDLNRPRKIRLRGNKTVPLDAVVDEMDFIINAAKLKTHSLTGLTAAVKNVYGCVPGKAKARLHLENPLTADFSHLCLEIYLAVKPGLSILDAVIAMEGTGPRKGIPRRAGLLAASKSGLALDRVAAEITGFHPNQVTTLGAARQRGLREAYLSNIAVEGLSLAEARLNNFDRGAAAAGRVTGYISRLPFSWLRNLIQRHRRPYPSINDDKCTGCRICLRHCPAQIMTMDGNKVRVARESCIRCYCCQELCPHGAIDLV